MELQPQGQKPTEITDHNISRAQNALQGKTLANCSEEEIKSVLVRIYSMVGLRAQHYPVDQDKDDLHQYIFFKYGKKTTSELILAFDLAISGELGLKPEDVKVYDQFTIAYIAQIMSAYKNWLRNVIETVKPKAPSVMIEDKKNLTDEEKAQWIADWKQMPEINIELIPLLFYDFLTDKKIITPSISEKNEALAQAQNFIKIILHEDLSRCKTNDAYIVFNKFLNMEKDGFTGELKNKILNRAKKMIVYKYLTDQND